MALIGQAVSEKKIFENGGRRTDGRTTEHWYTISSPCEPDGSGELKTKTNEDNCVFTPHKSANYISPEKKQVSRKRKSN